MSTIAESAEPFVRHAGVRLVEAGPERAVVEQPAERELDNHVGVRHASALHAAGYEASRALVAAALGDGAATAGLRLVRSEIAYTAVGLGSLTTTAEPTGEGWDELGRTDAPVTVSCAVVTRSDEGKDVAKLELDWSVEPGAAS